MIIQFTIGNFYHSKSNDEGREVKTITFPFRKNELEGTIPYGECDTLGKEMTQLTEDKFLSVLGLSIHKQVNLSSQVIMIQTIITSMTKQIRMKS